MRFEESDRVLAGWLGIATDQGEEGLDDVDRRQFRRFEKSMVVRRCVVAVFVLPSCRRLRLRGCLGRAGILHGDHGWIEPGGVLFEMRDLANDMKTCIAPEMALDKANVMDPVVKRMSDKVVARCKVAAVLFRAYNAAPITSGMPRKTGMDCVSFLYGTGGPSRASG